MRRVTRWPLSTSRCRMVCPSWKNDNTNLNCAGISLQGIVAVWMMSTHTGVTKKGGGRRKKIELNWTAHANAAEQANFIVFIICALNIYYYVNISRSRLLQLARSSSAAAAAASSGVYCVKRWRWKNLYDSRHYALFLHIATLMATAACRAVAESTTKNDEQSTEEEEEEWRRIIIWSSLLLLLLLMSSSVRTSPVESSRVVAVRDLKLLSNDFWIKETRVCTEQ